MGQSSTSFSGFLWITGDLWKSGHDTLYFMCDTLLWKYNRFSGWTHSNPLPDSCFSIEFSNTNPPILIASNAFARCYLSQDYGTSWREIDYNFPVNYPIIYNWTPTYDTIRQVLWLPTSGGLFYAPLTELSSTDYQLNFQSLTIGKIETFPNPSNQQIFIRFELPNTVGKGVFKIFNNSGQQVYLKDIDNFHALNHLRDWSSKDFSSGTYFIRFTAEGLPHPLQSKFTIIK